MRGREKQSVTRDREFWECALLLLERVLGFADIGVPNRMSRRKFLSCSSKLPSQATSVEEIALQLRENK